jgi:hypothetical protein
MEIKTYYKEVKNEEKQGIELYFDTIPTRAEREELKNNGYKWHSVKKCWYKRIADNKSKNIKTQNEKSAIQLGVEKMENSYTGYGWKGVNSNKGYSMKEIAKLIKGELKRKYADCTFSVTKGGNNYCNTLEICLMTSSRNPFADFETAVKSETFLRRIWGKSETIQEQYKKELKETLDSGYMQICSCDSDYLSAFGKELFKFMQDLCNSFNFDDSDGQIDYFHCGFYDSFSIGKWNKKFELINE